ncbi:MAG: hypothetical protein JWO88_3838 [Frankiales bacterium]|nr:hypothetical protein [Frankiales bacterium]
MQPPAPHLLAGAPAWPAPPTGYHQVARPEPGYAIACWWTLVLATVIAITSYGDYFLPDRFRNDVPTIYALIRSGELWQGISYDGFVNTARVWSLVISVVSEQVAMVSYAVLLVVVGARLLKIWELRSPMAQAMAGAWFICAAVFLAQPSKEIIALPVAVFFCVAGRPVVRWLAALVIIGYAVYFRQYWGITLIYFLAVAAAFRLHRSGRPGVAALLAAAAMVTPFVAAELLSYPPLTDSRNIVNEVRVVDADTRSSFSNPIENTGAVTDAMNALLAWVYLNVPVVLASQLVMHYLFFALFQVATLVFFVRGCRRCLEDARKCPGAEQARLAVRCAAFVIAYSATQSIFEPDFGSFLRHQVVIMLPILIVACYQREPA